MAEREGFCAALILQVMGISLRKITCIFGRSKVQNGSRFGSRYESAALRGKVPLSSLRHSDASNAVLLTILVSISPTIPIGVPDDRYVSTSRRRAHRKIQRLFVTSEGWKSNNTFQVLSFGLGGATHRRSEVHGNYRTCLRPRWDDYRSSRAIAEGAPQWSDRY
jgi:hypothetical protein